MRDKVDSGLAHIGLSETWPETLKTQIFVFGFRKFSVFSTLLFSDSWFDFTCPQRGLAIFDDAQLSVQVLEQVVYPDLFGYLRKWIINLPKAILEVSLNKTKQMSRSLHEHYDLISLKGVGNLPVIKANKLP